MAAPRLDNPGADFATSFSLPTEPDRRAAANEEAPIEPARRGERVVADVVVDHRPPARFDLRFEAKAQEVLPVRDVPSTPSGLGRWWGRVSLSPVVKSVLLGASTMVFAMGAQLTTLGRAFAAPKKKEIVFVGMNPGAKHEAKKLGRWAPEGVAFVGPARLQDRALVGGRFVDLATSEGQAAFTADLGLEGAAAAKLEHALELADDWGRDEMARLARVFAEAERGERTIERLVLSGHSLGAGLWGDDNGELSWAALAAFTEAFPTAARQVEDVLVAACYAGGRTQMEKFKAMFPRAKTLWGYAGSAPGAYSGAVWHMKRWERQTRGEGDARVDRGAVQKLRKGKSVAVWTESRGYDNGRAPRPLSTLRSDYARTRDIVPIYLSGVRQVADPGRGPLREHYGNLQSLLQRPELPEAERRDLEVEREMVIRLIYYRRISGYFERHHGPELERGYAAIGRDRPDFSRLSREKALAEILGFSRAAARSEDPAVSEAETLLNDGLRDLSPERIPSSWL